MNKRFGYKKADLTDAVLICFWAEYEARDKLREIALKENRTMGEIIRQLIRKFLNKS